MEECVEFDINDALKHYTIDPQSVATPEAPSELVDAVHDPESLTPALVNSVLNSVIDDVAESPDAITRSSVFDTLQFLLKQSEKTPLASLSKVFDLVTSAISTETDLANGDIDADNEEALPRHKQLLQMYAFLLQWAVSAIETRVIEQRGTTTATGRGKGAKAKKDAKDTSWDPSKQLEKSLDVMSKVLSLRLVRIFVATSERDTFVGMFTKAVYHILENEARVKTASIKRSCFKVLCIAVRNHGQAFSAQTAINQNLSYFEHLSEPMAEFLHILAQEYAYPQLTEEVLKELSNKEFNSNDTKGPKSVSAFLMKISELQPQLVNKHMALLANLLESESYTLRMALIQVCGNLIQMLSQQYVQEPSEDLKRRMKTLLEVLEERFRDLNPYCRCRVMQVYIKLCDMEWTWPKQRQTVAHLTALSLKDKSSHVRRNAIKLMVKLVNTNLFNREGDCLAIGPWMKKLSETEAQIAALEPQLQEGEEDADEQTVDATLLQEATQIEVPKNPDDMTDEERLALEEKLKKKFATEQMLAVLQKTRKFLVHGLRFIEIVNEAAEMVMLLLSSKNKNEVIDAMDFFTVMDYFKIQNARAGIRKMLRLIWTKGNSDEGKGVQTHLIDCYRNLFFDAPPNFTPNDAANYISRNMMSLTYGTTPAELTSLEQLLSTMMKQGFVNELVIQKLWQVYGYQKRETSKSQRRGAIIVLGMLALADPNIIKNEMDTCLRIGLGELGRRDLVLARYTCVALSRISPPPAKQQMQTAAPEQVIRLPHEHPILLRLAAITELVSDSKEWFGVAEQAISAIYVLAKNPDVFCSNILRRKTKYVFSPSTFSRPTTSGSATTTGSVPPTQDAAGDVEMQDAPVEDVQMEEASAEPPEPARPSKTQNPAIALSQLLFIVGHVAIKQIVHLGLCEEEHNRREAEKKKKKPTPRNSAASEVTSGRGRGRGRSKTARIATPGLAVDDELDLMAGGDQDEFRDKIERVREEELLYGYNSLLARYGPLVAKICANKAAYNHPTLQAQAALCLAKFMCVSKQYCKENLILFLRLVQGSKDAVVRSNLVIGLGDVIICFEELVEEYMPLLYERLTDRESSVKRTCLMTLSFLMLASRVKVGGRELGNIAKCLEDDDPIFVEMARTFFSELATKDKAVYGNFQNTFQLLSADTTLSEEAFRRIIKYIAGFIEKDKEAKSTVKHLKEKMEKATTERQWNDFAYAIGLFNHKDEEATKLIAAGFRGRAAAEAEADGDGDVEMAD